MGKGSFPCPPHTGLGPCSHPKPCSVEGWLWMWWGREVRGGGREGREPQDQSRKRWKGTLSVKVKAKGEVAVTAGLECPLGGSEGSPS